jgi:5-methylcytosine-specific restriction endonuclease McrA
VPEADRGAIAFGEKLLTLLDFGSFTATYKYAVLLGLTDLCLECSTRSGDVPDFVTTRQLAEKVVQLYWPHTLPFSGPASAGVLRQNTSGQAEIVTLIARFRESHLLHAFGPLTGARPEAPEAFERLLGAVEWKLVEMPLPRLQQLGTRYDPFIYSIHWDASIRRAQAAGPDFDNRILFAGQAAEHLVRLAGLLRPLLQRQWAAMVARLNRGLVEDAQLEEFLFGRPRTALARVKRPLRELQENRCFYCDSSLTGVAEVDHFIPWARYPDDAIENLVLADRRCNNAKRDFLASAEHVARWTDRLADSRHLADLRGLAATARWDSHPSRTLSVARAMYLRLPADALLWDRGGEFVAADRRALRAALLRGDDE